MQLMIRHGTNSVQVSVEYIITPRMEPREDQPLGVWEIKLAGGFGTQINWPLIGTSKWPEYKRIVGAGTTLDVAVEHYVGQLMDATGPWENFDAGGRPPGEQRR